jgi:hypothetical protein
MAFNRSHARGLCNASELSLFESSVGAELASFTAAQLKAKIVRARSLRDKQQDLLRRQKLATRTRSGMKVGLSGVANQRTEQKLKLFSEVLARVEARLAAVEASSARAAARAAAASGKKAGKPAGGRPSARQPAAKKAVAKKPKARAAGFVSAQARDASNQMQLKKSRSTPIQAHLRSAGKRSQARRDSR